MGLLNQGMAAPGDKSTLPGRDTRTLLLSVPREGRGRSGGMENLGKNHILNVERRGSILIKTARKTRVK